MHTIERVVQEPWWSAVTLTQYGRFEHEVLPADALEPGEILARINSADKNYCLFFVGEDHWSLTIDGWKLVGPSVGSADMLATVWHLSVPVLDTSRLSDGDVELGCSLIPLPALDQGKGLSPQPWNALSYAPLPFVLTEWASLGAFVANIPEVSRAEEIQLPEAA